MHSLFSRPWPLAAALGVLALSASAQAQDAAGAAGSGLSIEVLSSKPEHVTGGDALIGVSTADVAALSVRLNGQEVSIDFRVRPQEIGGSVGLLTGLLEGENTLEVTSGNASASLTLTNYPKAGPVLSGPHIEPFFCQSASFVLPDGSLYGAPSDETTCETPTLVHYLYLREGASTLTPLASTESLPEDVAMTTITTGAEVPFVVRVETGMVNRGIYQSAILFDPVAEDEPAPGVPLNGWNNRLVAIHGFGCPGGWYVAGGAQGNLPSPTRAELLDTDRLGEGYAIFTSTLQHPSNACNSVLQAESAMMSKERFIEVYGPPDVTVSHGCSGGSYSSHQLADQMPGLFDGILIACTFPDPMSIAVEGLHGHLLAHLWMSDRAGTFTDEEKIAITGYKSVLAFIDAARQSGRTDPVAREDLSGHVPGYVPGNFTVSGQGTMVPEELRYHPTDNPTGARPTVFDAQRNALGVDPETGFALRPFDNLGVQYGLRALLEGAITPETFLALNEHVGGYDQDANFVAERSVGDEEAIRRSYQSGLQFGGNGGTGDIPILDISGIYNDDSAYHYQWFHFANRERVAEGFGDDGNYVMWRGRSIPYETAWNGFISWVEAVQADPLDRPSRESVLGSRTLTDGCFDGAGHFIAERQTLSAEPDTACNALLPSWEAIQIAAGGPVSASILKCALKPVRAEDYAPVEFSEEELARLEDIFPEGVCDWSQPGIGQVPVVPYASFGPSPVNLVFDITAP